jgi:hypothetical protein
MRELALLIPILALSIPIIAILTRHKERKMGIFDAKDGPVQNNAEIERQRIEIRELKERIQVLERVITDTNSASSLDREIEKLR